MYYIYAHYYIIIMKVSVGVIKSLTKCAYFNLLFYRATVRKCPIKVFVS